MAFATAVFVLTKEIRDPWERPGGTTFYFVNDGIESALVRARAAAGGRDVRIGGGARVVQEYLDAGLVDDFSLAVAPILLGNGRRLFDEVARRDISLEIEKIVDSPRVTHLSFAIRKS